MVYIDTIIISPNPVDTGEKIIINVELHEEYEGAKKYADKYPYRYGEVEDS